MRILTVLIIATFVEIGISLPQSQSTSEPIVRDQVGAIDDSNNFDAGIDEGGLDYEQSPTEITENTELVGGGLGQDLAYQTSDETNSAAMETDCSPDDGSGINKKRSNSQCSAHPESQNFQSNQQSGSTPNLPPNKRPKRIKKKGKGNGERTKSPSPDQSAKTTGPPQGDLCPASKVPLTRPLCCAGEPITLGSMVVGCTPCKSFL